MLLELLPILFLQISHFVICIEKLYSCHIFMSNYAIFVPSGVGPGLAGGEVMIGWFLSKGRLMAK